MQLVSRKNFLLALAALLVVALGFMALTLSGQFKKPKQKSVYDTEIQKIESQSTSDDINSIEKDLKDTDFENLDRELQDIDKELEATM